MNKEQRNSKKELARALYLKTQQTQDEICEFVGVSRRTLGLWIKKEAWNDLRSATTVAPINLIAQLNRQLNEINEKILSRPEGERYATAKESDAMLKIATTIKKLQNEVGVSEAVHFSMNFLSWMREIGEHDKGREFVKYFDSFLQDYAMRKK